MRHCADNGRNAFHGFSTFLFYLENAIKYRRNVTLPKLLLQILPAESGLKVSSGFLGQVLPEEYLPAGTRLTRDGFHFRLEISRDAAERRGWVAVICAVRCGNTLNRDVVPIFGL